MKTYRHPNADGRLFRVSDVVANNYRMEIGRVRYAGNLIPMGEEYDFKEAQEFANSCEEMAREWVEDERPKWLIQRMARVFEHSPCERGAPGRTCVEAAHEPFDCCVPCAARLWLIEFARNVE